MLQKLRNLQQIEAHSNKHSRAGNKISAVESKMTDASVESSKIISEHTSTFKKKHYSVAPPLMDQAYSAVSSLAKGNDQSEKMRNVKQV